MNKDRAKDLFIERMHSLWLPSFCDARAGNFLVEGIVEKSIDRLTGFDAYWFMRAVDNEIVVEEAGFFTAPRTTAKEQIFWSGNKTATVRDIYVWAEPIITIGAVAWLHEEFGWPIEQLGTQSKYPWPFDLICYEPTTENYRIACEVKKANHEVTRLIKLMKEYSASEPLETEPLNSTEQNAYRKIVGIRATWPEIFWALGPDGIGEAFAVCRKTDGQQFDFFPWIRPALVSRNSSTASNQLQ
ncbi:MAG: hypothetical protein QNL16_09255 [Rhodobacterales bacterium]